MRNALMLNTGIAGILASNRAPIVLTPAYANTLTGIITDIYTAMDVISRELVGFFPSAMRAPSAERAGLNQQIKYPVAPAQQAYDITPSMTIPEPPDNTVTTDYMTISKERGVPFGFTGNEQRTMNAGFGPNAISVQAMMVGQALRTLTNEVEADLAIEAALNASRAYGTAGTTPFGSGDLTDLAQIEKILDDNGAPATGRSMVMNTNASSKLITIGNLSKANEAGSNMTLRQGELLDIYGMSCKKSGQYRSHTKGTAASSTTNTTGYAVGATVIGLAAVGTGTYVAGDVVTFAGDTNKYLVVSGDADVSGGGSITIAAPGLRRAIPASATAITVGNNYIANVGFSQSALHVATRAPAIPDEGDAAVDRMLLTDPFSGITYEFCIYVGYKKVRYEVGLAWGVKASKREHIALLLG